MKASSSVTKLLGAAALLLAAACGETAVSTKCTSNSNCLTDEVCLTGPGVCTKSCMSQSDCSSASTPSCVGVAGSTTVKACQCVAGLDTCGAGRVCSGGACVTGSSGSDSGVPDAGSAGCTPACTSAQYCDTSGATPTCAAKCTWGSCTTGVCNFATGACGPAATCAAANAQPDTCNYGNFCNGGTCAGVSKPGAGCTNFGSTGKMLAWDPATNSGPVIFSITKVSFATDTTACAAPNTKLASVTVKAYTTDSANLFPATKTALTGLTRVNSTGATSAVDLAAEILPSAGYVVSQGGKEVTFPLRSCVAPTVTSFSLGLYFTNGNEACFTVN